MVTFSFNPPINPSEEGKNLLAVTIFEAINSFFNIIDENISFPISTPRHWPSRGGAETNRTLRKLLMLRFENDIDSRLREV